MIKYTRDIKKDIDYDWTSVGSWKRLKRIGFNPKWWRYRLAWNWYKNSLTVRTNAPVHLDVETTSCCMLACPFCIQNTMKDYLREDGSKPMFGHMSLDLFKKIIDDAKASGVLSLKLHSRGEPFTNPAFLDMVDYAMSKKFVEVSFNTNGVMLNNERMLRLIKSRVHEVKFSFDGVNKEIYEKLRVGANFEEVVSNIKQFVSMRDMMNTKYPLIRVQVIDMKETHDLIDDFVKYWSSVVDSVAVSKYCDFHYIDEKSGTDHRIDEPTRLTIPCNRLWERYTIHQCGTGVMCCQDVLMVEPLGNAKEMSVSDMWHSERFEKKRKDHKDFKALEYPLCASCGYRS